MALVSWACGALFAGDKIALIGFAVDEEGAVVREQHADRAVNPASVVKLATTLWALEGLGPEHRFETRFVVEGPVDPVTGVLSGDLLAAGGADPDFHVENAVLVARALSAGGLQRVAGTVGTAGDFWLGWEGGAEGRVPDPGRRRQRMARRLRDALDGSRHDLATRRAVEELCVRRHWEECGSTGLAITGDRTQPAPAGAAAPAPPAVFEAALVHRSNPLPVILNRFNTWSNNDIERLGTVLGDPAEMAAFLEARWGSENAAGIRFSTLSGLESNRMTPRQIVRLVRDLDATARRHGLALADLIGTAGCDEGTLGRFSRLAEVTGSVTGKTGTLVQTDGGVAAFAGTVNTASGRLFFSVLAPRNGARLAAARAAQERWILSLAEAHGGLAPAACPPEPGFSDDDIQLERLGEP